MSSLLQGVKYAAPSKRLPCLRGDGAARDAGGSWQRALTPSTPLTCVRRFVAKGAGSGEQKEKARKKAAKEKRRRDAEREERRREEAQRARDGARARGEVRVSTQRARGAPPCRLTVRACRSTRG